MNTFFATIVMILFSIPAYAESVGFLKIVVLKVRSDHNTDISLHLNGKKFTQFSHATEGPQIKAIDKSFLSNAESTPLDSDYSTLKKGCQFDFSLFYSFDQNDWISLGVYHAPSSAVRTSLPIGICNGKLCSSDSKIASALEELEQQRWRRETALEKNRLFMERFILESNLTDIENRVSNAKDPEIPEERFESLEEVDEVRRYSEDEALPASPAGPSSTEMIAKALQNGTLGALISEIDFQEKFVNDCLSMGSYSQTLCVRYGSFGWAGAIAEASALSLQLDIDPEAVRKRFERINSEAPASDALRARSEQLAEIRFEVQRLMEVQRSMRHWNEIGSYGRTVVAFTPLSDILDYCESFTGREFCLTDGRELSKNERLFAVAGIIIGSRMTWEWLFKGSLGDVIVSDAKRIVESAAKSFDRTGLNNFLDIIKDERGSWKPIGEDISKVIEKIKYPNLWSEGKFKDHVKNALKHFENHGKEFPELNNAVEYVEKAHEFMKAPPAGTLTKVRPNGDKLFYHPETNVFATQTIEGAPRTMFKPDPKVHRYSTNLEYFNAQ
jgi:hypothetical protein